MLTITTLVIIATLYENCLKSRKHAKLDSEIQETTDNNNELKNTDVAISGIDKDAKLKPGNKGNHTGRGEQIPIIYIIHI